MELVTLHTCWNKNKKFTKRIICTASANSHSHSINWNFSPQLKEGKQEKQGQKWRVGQREKTFHISRGDDGELHLISPSALHMCCECSERAREGEASSAKWKFLCFSHSCSMTLQMAALPFVQPPGISPNHNGITSEKMAGKSDFII